MRRVLFEFGSESFNRSLDRYAGIRCRLRRSRDRNRRERSFPLARSFYFATDCLGFIPLPSPRVLTSEVLAKRSRNKDRTFTTRPVLLALVVFGGSAVVRVTTFAIQSMASVQGERHGPILSQIGPDWPRNLCLSSKSFRIIGGERGIRTLDRVSPIHAFQACAFNHSAISPGCRGTVLRRRKRPRQFSLTRVRPAAAKMVGL